jgi:CheY-like chemotaxis protein
VPAVTEDKVSILIVDDEPSVGDALRLVLESNGYEVVLVTKGMDGIDQARNRRFGFGVVDLFLTDISAHGSPQVFAEAKRLGAIGALWKPFPPAEILKVINSHVHGPTSDSN